MLELTGSWEECMDEAFQWNKKKYKGGINDSREGWKTNCLSVEALQGSPPIEHILHLASQDRGEGVPYVIKQMQHRKPQGDSGSRERILCESAAQA